MCLDRQHRPAAPGPALTGHRDPPSPGDRAASAPSEPTRPDAPGPENAESEAPSSSGPACANPTRGTHRDGGRPPERDRDNAQEQAATPEGEWPSPPADTTAWVPPGRARAGDLVEYLDDDDTGRWQVTTEASIYVLDLDARNFIRLPGAGPRADSQAIAVTAMLGDHRPLPLVAVGLCVVGDNLILLSEPRPDGTVNYRHSTYVLEIRRLPDRKASTRP